MPEYLKWLWEQTVDYKSNHNAKLVKMEDGYTIKNYDPKDCGLVGTFIDIAKLGFGIEIKLDGWDF